MTRDQWISAFASEIGEVAPSAHEVTLLLDLAGQAAHGSERTAAPIACWLAGRSNMSLEELLVVAARIGG